REGMRRESFDQAAAFHAPDRRTPAVSRKCIGESSRKRISSVAPQILRVIGPVDAFFVIEGFDGSRILAVRNTHQDVRNAHTHIARILALAESFPLRVLGGVEHLTKIAWLSEARE